ncbi:hemolysin D [Steroidobacter denitrificans]|uniref:Hemolysin D n=1 Tax=Steroidobacter denitrificans TaxID=465721 RepID=A0A127F9T4_STEDE|nr:efflux RND transporter periplasmic adaptor subunit [Steroidobacter denitrificans]AMN46365.1 hemolysin D [Steroidobacter denitrificans]
MAVPARALTALFASAPLVLTLAACGTKAPPPAAPVAVNVVTIKPQTVVLTRELPGRTVPFLVAEVRPQVSGIVERRLFTEGSLVKAGQALYQLEDATYRAGYDSAKAALGRAQATLVTAQLNFKRTAELVKIDAVSAQDFEDATAVARQAEADVMAAEAAVQSSRVTLGYARITAPISGRIGRSSVTQGALVTANQAEPLATIQQLDPIYIDVTAPSNEILSLRRELAAGRLEKTSDLPVTILLEDGSRYDHDGKLAFLEVTVDPTTGSFTLRVDVPNPKHLLLPGMYVRTIIAAGIRHGALLVPQRGILRDATGHTSALIVDADGKVERRVVQVNRTIGDQWLVESGLAAGERVIVEGLQKIQPGIPVQASELPTAAAPGDPSAPAASPAH